MKDKTRILPILATALLALVFSGSALTTAASASGAQIAAARLYLAAGCAAGLCALAGVSGAGALASLALLAALGGIYIPTHLEGLRAIPALAASWSGGEITAAELTEGSAALLTCLAFGLGALFYGLLRRREVAPLAILILFAMLIASHAMSLTASIPASLPGLAAGAAAFALTGAGARDNTSARALLPGILAMCVALALLPAGRLTWGPLEDAANRARDLFEQYFNFTRQRIAFSINEQGYDHAGEVQGDVVAMLGGPAEPSQDPVMKVTADEELLLRGTVRSTYTGYSWVDTVPRSRYLYYDLTRARVRDGVFGANLDATAGAFRQARADVEFLREGTSTLFAPVRLKKFDMTLSTAVYYNTAGELFLTRDVQPGDRYSLTALVPLQNQALRDAAARGEAADDAQWAEIQAAYTGLPEGIDNRVYALAMEITQGAATNFDRALAIQRYLAENMRYSLDVEYPPQDKDFVSYFLLESRTGYCSYYATAMAVLGRIAGLPTRYAEGYLARPGADGTCVLTGEDAHAWTEVYFKGLGWIPFDATGGSTGRTGGGSGGGNGSAGQDDGDGAQDENNPEGQTPSPSPAVSGQDGLSSDAEQNGGETLSPTPTIPPQDGGGQYDPGESPTPTPDDGDSGGTLPDGGAQDSPEPSPETPPEPDASNPPSEDEPPARWIWWILALLLILLIALSILWARRRLQRTDPIALSAAAEDGDEAALILYRACLTALGHMGQAPVNGEAPEAFAARVAAQQKNPEFAAFTAAVAARRYGRQPLGKADLAAGRKAYRRIEASLGRRERLRYALTRVARGIGDLERIP